MITQVLLAVAGLALLTVAADHLVLGSSRMAARMRVRPVVVGVVVIGLGTSAPEFLVSGLAAARGDTGLALGNLTGSNVLNLTLILGVAALLAKVTVTSAIIRREAPLAVAAIVLFAVLARAGLNVVSGLALTIAAGGAVWLLVRWAGDGRNTELAQETVEYVEGEWDTGAVPSGPAGRRSPAWSDPVRAMLGLAGVLAGAQLLVTNAAQVATRLGVPSLVIGFTLVALGTSLPELVTTVQAQRRGESDLVIGNLFGSNLFNSLAGGAVVAFAAPGGAPPASGPQLLIMVVTGVAAWVLMFRGMVLTRAEGGILLAAYVLAVPLLLST